MAEYSVDLVESILDVAAEEHNHLVGPGDFPFLRHEWLKALEKAECVRPESGWIPRHVVIRRGRELVALCPAYIKLHSYGEFVFDQGWAQAAELQLGIPYYPKLVIGVPFTPATGPRLLLSPELGASETEEVAELISHVLLEMLSKMQLSSAHVLFLDEPQAQLLEKAGFFIRLGIQYQFHNQGLADFEQFLAGFRAKRRAAIRRERRLVAEDGSSISVRNGQQLLPDDAHLAYRLYLTTVDKYVWGRRYLTRPFFEQVFATMPEAIHLVTAQDQQGQTIAGAFNLLGKHALYGRYWGCFSERRFLHFEVCLYRGVEECITLGLDRFEAGAGGEHKHGRGLVPTPTRSAHLIVDARLSQAAKDFCEREAEALRQELLAADDDET